MKLHCETYREKLDRLGVWRRWFAWHPVKVGTKECRWLEFVERRCIGGGYDGLEWEYRK